MVTLTNLRTLVYNLLREEQDSNAYPYTLVDQMINSAQLSICTGQVINPLTKEVIRKGRLPFLNTDKFYSNIQGTYISSASTIGDTTITVSDTSNFPSTGVLFINGEKFTYTSKTSTTFTGSTGVTFAHPSGTGVYALYALPTDYSSTIQVIYNYNFKLEAREYDDIFERLNSFKDNNYIRNINTYPSLTYTDPFYSILDRTYLAPFNLNQNGDMLHLRYEKLPTELSATTDEATIDNDIYAKATIPYLAAGEMLFNRGEQARAAELLNFGLGKVKEMYTYYNNSSFEKISGVQYKTGKQRNYNF